MILPSFGPPRQAFSEERSDVDTMPMLDSSGDDDGPDYEIHMAGLHPGSGDGDQAEDDTFSEQAEDEDTARDEEDSDVLPGTRFCINCTSRLAMDEEVCDDCGHAVANNAELFSCPSPSCSEASEPCTTSSSSVALLFDERMELHDEGALTPHPERPDRLRAIVARLLASGLGKRCRRIPCREATVPELCAVHTESLVQLVESASVAAATSTDSGPAFLLTSDTYINSHTYLCAKLAAGGAAEVAALLARGEAPHGAAIVRPPGHHAESGMAMGFCFFNNAAVAARAAQAAGAQRVLILDWDVHHGNGTQHIFEGDPSVLYMSVHRYDGGSFYPGTGGMTEVGVAEGCGYTVNVPWSTADMGNGDYVAAFNHIIVPIAYEYNPNLIIVSAGFDAADGDPIGECRVTPECFGHMTSLLKAVAPCLLLLEGGYNLASTAASTESCLRVLLGEQPASLSGPRYPSVAGWQAIQEVMQVQASYWNCLRASPTVLSPGRAQVTAVEVAAAAAAAAAVATAAASSGAKKTALVQQAAAGAGSSRLVLVGKRAAMPGGIKPRRTTISRSSHILIKIHKQAMRAFWKRQRKSSAKAA